MKGSLKLLATPHTLSTYQNHNLSRGIHAAKVAYFHLCHSITTVLLGILSRGIHAAKLARFYPATEVMAVR